MKFWLFIFIHRKKCNCKLLFIWIQAHHNEKMKQLVYPPPNIVWQWIDSFIISDSRWRSPTNKLVGANYSTDQKNSTGHVFKIKLEEKSYKISFKALPVKIHWSKNWQGDHKVPLSLLTGPDMVKEIEKAVDSL